MFREWIRTVFAPQDRIITLGIPRNLPRVRKSARPEDGGWRRSDLTEGRAVRFAICGRAPKKIAMDSLGEFKALSTPGPAALDSRSGPPARCW